MSVGAVYDRAPFPGINEIRAVTDRAYSQVRTRCHIIRNHVSGHTAPRLAERL
jgi:hypothetical protein